MELHRLQARIPESLMERLNRIKESTGRTIQHIVFSGVRKEVELEESQENGGEQQ